MARVWQEFNPTNMLTPQQAMLLDQGITGEWIDKPDTPVTAAPGSYVRNPWFNQNNPRVTPLRSEPVVIGQPTGSRVVNKPASPKRRASRSATPPSRSATPPPVVLPPDSVDYSHSTTPPVYRFPNDGFEGMYPKEQATPNDGFEGLNPGQQATVQTSATPASNEITTPTATIVVQPRAENNRPSLDQAYAARAYKQTLEQAQPQRTVGWDPTAQRYIYMDNRQPVPLDDPIIKQYDQERAAIREADRAGREPWEHWAAAVAAAPLLWQAGTSILGNGARLLGWGETTPIAGTALNNILPHISRIPQGSRLISPRTVLNSPAPTMLTPSSLETAMQIGSSRALPFLENSGMNVARSITDPATKAVFETAIQRTPNILNRVGLTW